MCAYIYCISWWGGNISVESYLFVSLHNTTFMNKIKFNDFKKKKTNKTIPCLYKSSIIYKITRNFYSEKRLVIGQLGERKRVLRWSIYIISLCCTATLAITKKFFFTSVSWKRECLSVTVNSACETRPLSWSPPLPPRPSYKCRNYIFFYKSLLRIRIRI